MKKTVFVPNGQNGAKRRSGKTQINQSADSVKRTEVTLNAEELRALNPHPLLSNMSSATPPERQVLTASADAFGTLHHILIASENILLDGRERVAAAIAKGQPLKAWKFEATEQEQKEIILGITFGRTHWNDGQKALIAAEQLCIAEGLSKRRAAAKVGLSPQYVCEAAKLLASNDTELINEVRNQITPLRTASRKLRDKIEREIHRAAASEKPSALVELRYGLFQSRTVDLPDNSVDLVITDPLYDLVCIPDIVDMAKLVERILKPGGVLVLMFGCVTSDEMVMALRPNAPSLRKIWNFSAKLNGAISSHPGRRVLDEKRDYFAYVKTSSETKMPKTINGMPHSLFELNGSNTLYSPFGQKEDAFVPFIEWYTNPGDLILDPFTGGGAVPSACENLGRRCIACESDRNIFEGIVGYFFGKSLEQIRAAQDPTTWGKVEIG